MLLLLLLLLFALIVILCSVALIDAEKVEASADVVVVLTEDGSTTVAEGTEGAEDVDDGGG